MNESPRKTTVTLEDLLRVKRAEQPAEEFWTEFDRGLRTKQLAAIVEPRPWWAPLIRVGARITRYQVPVGATAVLAITLLAVRGYHPATTTQGLEPSIAETASLASPVPAISPVSVPDVANIPSGSSTAAIATVNEPAPAPAAIETSEPKDAPAATPTLGAASHVAMMNSELSSARYMADNLAAAQPGDPELDQMLGRSVRSADSNAVRTEPLTQVNVSDDSRSRRLMAGMAWAASVNSSDSTLRSNEQSTRHLSERRLAESDVISRLEMEGNQVRIKF
jgi:hypothetical protein